MAVVFLLLNNESCIGQVSYNMIRNNVPRYNQNINYNNGIRYNTPNNTIYGQNQYVQQPRKNQLLQNNMTPVKYPNNNANSYIQTQNKQVGQNQYQARNIIPSQNNNNQNQIKQNNNNKSSQVTTQQVNNNISTQLSNIQKTLNTISSQLNTLINNRTVTTPQQSNKTIQNTKQNTFKEDLYINTGAAVANAVIPGSGTIIKNVASNKDIQNIAKNIINDPKTKQIVTSVGNEAIKMFKKIF